ncbi:hypothetical protein HanPI659440_Chr05g0192551 [Helianthus annuus]|nr:hypothetical protein HanOQP8_Chr05g0176101 [Helianthus annuus]KAJ0749312.1 hypothetical protein HanLR1_Chr05g0168401 [Helianthus annuus]KAJ0788510.1 hypothetical protein HanPI659440_Chr05g0192551 [Helianthus annuus]KAJ0921557.1 hypothetical protein HanPSC8_Chr05g0192941 [Helianthus annuus]
MAVAGSSSGGGERARKRGPSLREEPALQVDTPDWTKRHIKYRAPERIPICKINNRADHPLFQFALDTHEWKKYDRLKSTDFFQHRSIDWGWLDDIGSRQEVLDLLGPRLRLLMDCPLDQYEELVLEFHSTWKHKEGKFAENNVVSFSLGRKVFEMNMAQFAVASGYYTEEEVKEPGFSTSLRGVYSIDRDYSVGAAELRHFWSAISDHRFELMNLITSVHNPIYRYVLKILSTTLVGRKSGKNKANWIELFILMCRVENREMNLATVLADLFSRGRRGGRRAALDRGPYISHLALNLGVFDKYNPGILHEGPKKVLFGIKELQQAGIVSYTESYGWEQIRQGLQVQPPEGHPVEDVMMQIDPTHRQWPPQRHERPAPQYPRRQPPPEQLTLESLSGYVEQRFYRLEHLIQTGQERQEEALRYIITRHNMGTPDFFQPRELGGSAGAGERFDPIPPFHVFGEGGSGAGGREDSSEESASEHDDD